jgi:hypothetical protein
MSDTKNNLYEIGADIFEPIIDSLIDNENIKEIPILGTLYKICSVGVSISDKIFEKKIKKFIQELQSQPNIEIVMLINLLDSNKQKKILEIVLLNINNVNELEKIKYLAKLFKTFLTKNIDISELNRLFIAVNNAYYEDLCLFTEVNPILTNNIYQKDINNDEFSKNLLTSGLTRIYGQINPVTGMNSQQITYITSDLGDKFLRVINS